MGRSLVRSGFLQSLHRCPGGSDPECHKKIGLRILDFRAEGSCRAHGYGGCYKVSGLGLTGFSMVWGYRGCKEIQGYLGFKDIRAVMAFKV